MLSKPFRFLLFLTLFGFVSCAKKPAETVQDPLIDSVVTRLVDSLHFNGNVLVAEQGKVIYQKSFGLARFDTNEKLNDSSLFELASVSKQFTAMGIMILKEQGKLAYEDDIRKFIAELPYQGITLRHLLTHTSGLPDYLELFEKHWDRKKIAYNSDIVTLLAQYKPEVLFAPGQKWEYSNTAYTLLAVVIEKVSGQGYGEFLSQHIFKPIGMKRTRTYNTRRSAKEIIPNYAYGYVYSDSLKKYFLPDSLADYFYVTTLDGIVGDGIVNSTTTDLHTWDQALYTEKLVKTATLEEAYTPVKLNDDTSYNYGFGWSIFQDSTVGKTVSHGGGWPGYHTFIFRMLDRNACIILLSNNESAGLYKITKEILRIHPFKKN